MAYYSNGERGWREELYDWKDQCNVVITDRTRLNSEVEELRWEVEKHIVNEGIVKDTITGLKQEIFEMQQIKVQQDEREEQLKRRIVELEG